MYAIDPAFEKGYAFSKDGLARVRVSGGWGYINPSGKMHISPRFEKARDFHEGLAAVKETSKKWGYISTTGAYVIPPTFDKAHAFLNGWTLVSVDGNTHYIDRTGKIVWQQKYR